MAPPFRHGPFRLSRGCHQQAEVDLSLLGSSADLVLQAGVLQSHGVTEQPHHGNVHYLHGALHLYRGDQRIKKLTWRRTDIALIDQIRRANIGGGLLAYGLSFSNSAHPLACQ
jgi:hypothetical protein